MSRQLFAWLAHRRHQAKTDDRGAGVVETVIIAAGMAALAIGVVAAITLLVNEKLVDISL